VRALPAASRLGSQFDYHGADLAGLGHVAHRVADSLEWVNGCDVEVLRQNRCDRDGAGQVGGALLCAAAHLVFDGRPAGRPRVEAASRCLTRKRMWFITARGTTSGLTKYQQLAGQRLVLEQLPYPGALTLGQFPGPRVTMPIGERVGDGFLALIPCWGDRG